MKMKLRCLKHTLFYYYYFFYKSLSDNPFIVVCVIYKIYKYILFLVLYVKNFSRHVLTRANSDSHTIFNLKIYLFIKGTKKKVYVLGKKVLIFIKSL